MNKDQTLQAIVDHYELDHRDEFLKAALDAAYEWGKANENICCSKQIQSTVSRLQSEKDDANLYNKRKLQSQILILEQVMEDNSVRFRILPPNKHR